MKKNIGIVLLFILLCTLLTCFGVGNKAASASIIYAATAVLSLATAVGYRFLIRKRDPWFVLLFASVLIVNTGYLALSLSGTLNAALWANRLSYLGREISAQSSARLERGDFPDRRQPGHSGCLL